MSRAEVIKTYTTLTTATAKYTFMTINLDLYHWHKNMAFVADDASNIVSVDGSEQSG
jgi:hypothetical protein